MRNQFFYKRQGVEFPEGVEPFDVEDSFNPDYVIRTSQYAPGKLVVLLDDFHEMPTEKKVPVGKNGKIEVQRQKEIVCSEIWLDENDSKRYREMFEMETGTTDFVPLVINETTGQVTYRKQLSETTTIDK